MGLIPETLKTHNDVLDLLVDACQSVKTVRNLDGTVEQTMMLDPEKTWWKTHIVNSPTFARFAYELKEFERMGKEAVFFMPADRAAVIQMQINEIGLDYRYSIDAKSSESLRNNMNTQPTLLDKMQRNRIEKAYTLKGDLKRSMMDGWLGREVERDSQEE